MGKGAVLSLLLHSSIILLFLIGLPNLFRRELSPPPVIPIEVINISDLTKAPDLKVKPQEDGPKEELKEKPTPPKPTPIAEKIPDPDPTPEPEAKPEPETKPEPIEPELTMDDLLDPIVKEEPKKEEKPKEKKKQKKKEKKKKKPKKDVTSLLNSIEKLESSSEGPTQPDQDESSTAKHASNIIGDLSITELDLIRQQLKKYWIPPAGAKNAQNFTTEIRIHVNPDCTVQSTEIVSTSHPNDPSMRSFAESANRAIHKSKKDGPLKLPPDRCATIKTILINFDPKGML